MSQPASGAGPIRTVSLNDAPRAVADLLGDAGVEAVQIHQPPLQGRPYCKLVKALLDCPGFKLDLRGQQPRSVLAMVADQLLGADTFQDERAGLAADIAALEAFVRDMLGSPPPQTAIRTYFAPGDLVWHVDRVNERSALRLVWPIGRSAGMAVTPSDNVDGETYLAYMRREHPLLCQLDTRVLRTGRDVEQLWAHRPTQLEAMKSGAFPFIRDPTRVAQVEPNAISIHRIETPAQRGTYHRSSWVNRDQPGLQIVITATAD